MKRLLILAALIAACTAGAAVAQTGSGPSPESLSSALVAAPIVDRTSAGTPVAAESARTVAAQLGRDVPLPAGGTFNGIRWEQAGGTFTPAEIATMLQYNAACQWLRAARDGRDADLSEHVLADVPSWSAWRGLETAELLASAIAGGPAAGAALAECDASRTREVAYAEALGLTPTR